ncbi:MAG: universal stress protein [Burkholderiales bacterium]
MFTNILIPTDGSELSAQAANRAIALAKIFKAKATIVLVSPTYKQLTDEGFMGPSSSVSKREWEKGIAARAGKVLDTAAAEAKRAGVTCETVHVFRDQPHLAIVDTAKKSGCDLIVMGSHGYGGVKQLLLGSETTRVLSHSKIPVLVYR